MNASDALNKPVTMSMGGRDWKVSRLSLGELLGEFETMVKDEYIKDLALMSKGLTDPKDRQELQRQALKAMPRGRELEEQARSMMETFDGATKLLYMALSKHNPVSEQECRAFATDAKCSEGVAAVMEYASGSGADADKPEGKLEGKAEPGEKLLAAPTA